MFELVSEQYEEFCKAVCGCGEYRLDDDYRVLEAPHAEWVLMTPEQRKKQINKVVKCKVKSLMSHSSSLESVTKLSIAWNDAILLTYSQIELQICGKKQKRY